MSTGFAMRFQSKYALFGEAWKRFAQGETPEHLPPEWRGVNYYATVFSNEPEASVRAAAQAFLSELDAAKMDGRTYIARLTLATQALAQAVCQGADIVWQTPAPPARRRVEPIVRVALPIASLEPQQRAADAPAKALTLASRPARAKRPASANAAKAKRPAASRAKKALAAKPASKKKTVAKKTMAQKMAVKKTAAKKPVAKKPVAEKMAAKKPVAKKPPRASAARATRKPASAKRPAPKTQPRAKRPTGRK